MAKTEVLFCDNCGDVVWQNEGTSGHAPFGGTQKPYRNFTELPWNIASANAGESGTVCEECIAELTAEDDVPEGKAKLMARWS